MSISTEKRAFSSNSKLILGFLWSLMKSHKKSYALILVLDIIAWPLDSLLWPVVLRWVIDVFNRYDQTRSLAWPDLKAPILFALALVVFVEISSRLMGFLMAKVVPKLQREIRLSMFDYIQHHSPKYFHNKFAGSLANRITDMASEVDVLLNQLFWPIVPTLSTCIMGAIILGFIKPLFSILFVSWMVIHTAICIYFTRSIGIKEQKHAQCRSQLIGKIIDSFANSFAVNLFYRFNFEKRYIQFYQNKEERENHRVKYAIEKMRVVLSIIYFLVVVFGVFGALIYSWLRSWISTGEVVQVFTTLWSFAMVVWSFGNSLPLVFQSYGVIKQAYKVLLDPQDLGDRTQATNLKVKQGEIHLKAVSFNYGSHTLFKDLNLKIKGGEKVGIVGYTGAGKSTLVHLLLRLLPLSSGQIEIDGQNISEVTLVSLRRQVALIPQNTDLFHRSIAENIAYGKPDAELQEIIDASKSAHCHEFVQRMHGQYQAKIGEKGTKLSGGERQRVSIARAFLVDAPILVLDEATSALDSVTERYLQDSLKKVMEDKTVLVIAHRLSTLTQMDRIIVLDRGQIVEEGAFETLKQNGGLFEKMWNMQMGGFLPEKPVLFE